MAGSVRSPLLAALASVAVGATVSAQTPTLLEGRVVRVTQGDTVGLAGARVVLHQLGRGTQGPVDSVFTAPNGRFRLSFASDTARIYLISARHHGIEFFGDPMRGGEAVAPVLLRVSDTSSTTPVSLTARYVIIGAPDAARLRTVVDLMVLRNAGEETRVAADSLTPTWVGLLPIGTGAGARVSPAGTEISPEAIEVRGDSVRVHAPFSPGQKQLILEYQIPAGADALLVPFDVALDTVQVVTEEPGARVEGGTLQSVEAQVVDGRPLERWMGRVDAGTVIRVGFPRRTGAPAWLLPGVALGLLGMVALVTRYLLRRRAVPVPDASDPSDLIDAVARLDARYAGREAETPRDEWIAYQEERATLAARAAEALAGRPRAR